MKDQKPTHGIAVDGYCKGNPGPCGYKGVDLATGEVLFQCHLKIGTNNLAEFIGIVHALGYIKKKRTNHGTVYSDSEIAIAWVDKKEQGSKFYFKQDEELTERIRKCEMFLVETKSLPNYKKWKTKEWGEIPADFGHKNKNKK